MIEESGLVASIDWPALLQWTGWASFGGIVVALVTLWLKDRADRRMLGVERDKVAVSARGVEVSAAQVVVQERTADAGVMEAMTRTYQGLIAALKDRVDELEERVTEVEGRELHCLKRVADLETEQGRLQAALWRLRNSGGGVQ